MGWYVDCYMTTAIFLFLESRSLSQASEDCEFSSLYILWTRTHRDRWDPISRRDVSGTRIVRPSLSQFLLLLAPSLFIFRSWTIFSCPPNHSDYRRQKSADPFRILGFCYSSLFAWPSPPLRSSDRSTERRIIATDLLGSIVFRKFSLVPTHVYAFLPYLYL